MTHTNQCPTRRGEETTACFEDFWARQLDAVKRRAQEQRENAEDTATHRQEGLG